MFCRISIICLWPFILEWFWSQQKLKIQWLCVSLGCRWWNCSMPNGVYFWFFFYAALGAHLKQWVWMCACGNLDFTVRDASVVSSYGISSKSHFSSVQFNHGSTEGFSGGSDFAETGSIVSKNTIQQTQSDHTIRRSIHQVEFPER